MVVHSVLSGYIAGFGYEDGTLRIVLKSGKAYDYFNVTEEDAGLFAQGLGKAYNSVIKKKYRGSEKPVTDTVYFPVTG